MYQHVQRHILEVNRRKGVKRCIDTWTNVSNSPTWNKTYFGILTLCTNHPLQWHRSVSDVTKLKLSKPKQSYGQNKSSQLKLQKFPKADLTCLLVRHGETTDLKNMGHILANATIDSIKPILIIKWIKWSRIIGCFKCAVLWLSNL